MNKNKNGLKSIFLGFSVGEEQYTLLTVDEDVLYGKGKEGCSRFIVVRLVHLKALESRIKMIEWL